MLNKTAIMAAILLAFSSESVPAVETSSTARVEALSSAWGGKASVLNKGHIAGETGVSLPNGGGQAEFLAEAKNGAKGTGSATGGLTLDGNAQVASRGPNNLSGSAGTGGVSFAQTDKGGKSWAKIKGGSEVAGILRDPSIEINPPDPVGESESRYRARSVSDNGEMSFSSGSTSNNLQLNIGSNNGNDD